MKVTFTDEQIWGNDKFMGVNAKLGLPMNEFGEVVREIVAAGVEATADHEQSANEWRRLALQFDEHRMKAVWYLKALLSDHDQHRQAVEDFLKAPPLSGEEVLAKRLQTLLSEWVKI